MARRARRKFKGYTSKNKAAAPVGTSPARAPITWELDPYDSYSMGVDEAIGSTYHPGTPGLTYDLLRRMGKVPLISAIVGARINQIADYAVKGSGRDDSPVPGFRLRLRDREKTPTRAAKKKILEIQDWVETCGDPSMHREPVTFEMFTRAVIRDSLLFDQCNFEVVPTRGGKPAGFLAVDASTVRRARVSKEEREAGRLDPDRVPYVQIIMDKIRATYQRGEMAFGVRRPRTDLRSRGYGYPELEELVGTVTNLVNAETFNSSNFRHGVHSAGVLAVMSAMDKSAFRDFRRSFYGLLSGSQSAHKTPILQLDPSRKEQLQFVNFGQTNREMEYSNWISWLLRLACAIYQIDPAEIGYQYGNENQQSTLSQAGPSEKYAHSRERGLRPLLRQYQTWLNFWVIHEVDPDFELVFTGIDGETDGERRKAKIDEVKSYRTINEVRADDDLPKIDSPIADMILDSTYINSALQLLQQEQGEGEEGEEGPEGFPGGPEGEAGPPEGQEGGEAPEGQEGAPGGQEGGGGAGDVDIDALFSSSRAFGGGGG